MAFLFAVGGRLQRHRMGPLRGAVQDSRQR